MKKQILIACGTAIATSTHVAARVRELCEAHGIDVNIIQTQVGSIQSYADSVDLIITTTQVSTPVSAPILNGIPFLTGIGDKEVERQILEALAGEDRDET